MAKTPSKRKDGPRLFEQHEQALDRRIRRQRALFIPKYVKEAAASQQLSGSAQDKAYALAVQWADLETSGNPRWHNFLGLFTAVDRGNSGVPPIDRFNGGLFAEDREIDDLELDDEPWTTGFKGFGNYDFSEEVNVEVLGHLFERSITELEKLRIGGLFALKANIAGSSGNRYATAKSAKAKAKATEPAPDPEDSPLSKMPKSAQRKRFGIYYTPPAFTGLIVERTVDAVVRERFAALAKQHKVDPEARQNQEMGKLRKYWTSCLDTLKTVTVCDPACGSRRCEQKTWSIPMRLAQWLARTSFGIGCAVGLILNLGIVPVLDQHASAQAAACASARTAAMDIDPELQEWVDVQNEIANDVFGFGVEANACYQVNSAITSRGIYGGENQFGTAFSLNVAFALAIDLSSMSAEWVAARHVAAYQVFARMRGPAGDVPVVGTVVSIDNDYLGRIHQLWVACTLAESDYAAIAKCSEVYYGVWVVDTAAALPIEEVHTPLYGAMLFEDAPSVVLTNTVGEPGGNETQAECIERAQAKLKDAVDNANDDFLAAAAAATLALIAATGICLATTAVPFPGISLFLGGACMLTAITTYFTVMAGLALILANELAQAAEAFRKDMEACGVIVVGA